MYRITVGTDIAGSSGAGGFESQINLAAVRGRMNISARNSLILDSSLKENITLSDYTKGSTIEGKFRGSGGGLIGTVPMDGKATFDGLDDSIKICDNGGTPNCNWSRSLCNKGCSICAWVKPRQQAGGSTCQIVSRFDATGANQFFELNYIPYSNLFRFRVFGNGSGSPASSASTLAIYDRYKVGDTWQHVCGTFNGSSTVSGKAMIYMNGKLATVATSLVNISVSNWTQDEDTYIGVADDGSAGGSASFFNGSIKQVLIFNTTLTAAQVLQIYKLDMKPYGTNNNLLTHYPLNYDFNDTTARRSNGIVYSDTYIDSLDRAYTTITGDILPYKNNTNTLGTKTKRWKNIFVQNAVTVGDIVFSNNWRLVEAEKLTNDKLKGLVFVDDEGTAQMFLDTDGNLNVKGSVKEGWEGLSGYSFDDDGGVYKEGKVVKYPTVGDDLSPNFDEDTVEYIGDDVNKPSKPIKPKPSVTSTTLFEKEDKTVEVTDVHKLERETCVWDGNEWDEKNHKCMVDGVDYDIDTIGNYFNGIG
jgi:hypothetical protein